MSRVFVSMVVVLSLFPLSAMGGNSLAKQVHDLVKRVDVQYAQTKDLQADFIQETRIEGFDTPLRSSGRVYIKKPGLLRWDYAEPAIEQFYVNNDHLQMYVPAHNQILKGSLSTMVATKAPLQLLQGAGKLTEHFVVEPTGNGQRGEGDLPLLTLIPKNQDQPASSSIARIVSEIHPKTYYIQSVSLHEMSGNVSTFQFTNIKANTGLDDTVFTLNPPDDVVIVEDILPGS